MKIIPENYERHVKRFIALKRQIQTIPNVFASTSFAVKNKLIKFNALNNALKEFDKSTPMRH